MKRFYLIFFIMVLYTGSFASSGKIGFVDVKRVFKEFKGFFQAEQEMQKDVNLWREHAADMKREIEKMRKDVEERKGMLTESSYQKEMEKVKEAEKEYESYVDSIWGENGEIKKKYEQLIKPMVDVMYKIINKIAEEDGYSVILDSSQGDVIYVNKENDITDRVIEELNYEYGMLTKEITIVVFDFSGYGDLVHENLWDIKLADSLRTRLDSTNIIKVTDVKKVRIALKKDNIMPDDTVTLDEAKKIADDFESDYFVLGYVKSSGNSIVIGVRVYATQTGTELLKYEESVDSFGNITYLLDKIFEKVYDTVKQ